MTPEHKFQLLLAGIAVVPATILSTWAVINQRRQTQTRLQILPCPITATTIDGKQVYTNDWPGVVVRNLSNFPVRLCNIGYRLHKKFYQFGRPLDGTFSEMDWPREIQPRQRIAFYLNGSSSEGRDFANAIPADIGVNIWRTGSAYVATECGKWFYSKKLSRKSLAMLHDAGQ